MTSGPNIHPEKLAEFCRRHHIRRLAFFGSVMRGDAGPGSDIDVLYEFHPDHIPGWEIETIADELSSLLGRRADLVPWLHLSPHLRDRILAEAKVQYAA